jgi:hypothetical protein
VHKPFADYADMTAQGIELVGKSPARMTFKPVMIMTGDQRGGLPEQSAHSCLFRMEVFMFPCVNRMRLFFKSNSLCSSKYLIPILNQSAIFVGSVVGFLNHATA